MQPATKEWFTIEIERGRSISDYFIIRDEGERNCVFKKRNDATSTPFWKNKEGGILNV